ncbi:MAG TPA: restriction endonuclease subunit M [Firmicutes bacterium]|nr:restriction endonuclease subunit M [Bacillota bacterium]
MIKDITNANDDLTPNSREMAVLKENFPSCFKSDGTFDIERFKEFLSDKISVAGEGYELKFLGKNYARLLASVDTTTVVVPDEEHNSKPENVNSENIYISGDNLDGLKHLLKSYSGKVKCIYIDPPYNTGTDGFVYNDNFNFTVEELSEKLSISEEHAQRILDLTKRGSASHSAWLTFMYPRLMLARDLLADDGVIFISIDDNEQANLKLLCDDVFGEDKLASNIVWQKKTGASDARGIATITESILTYCKKSVSENWMNTFSENLDARDLGRYRCQDEYYDERGPYYPDTLDRGSIQYSDAMNYSIQAPDGTLAWPNDRQEFFNDGWTWKWSKEKVKWGIENDFIIFSRSPNKKTRWTVQYKVYLLVDNEGNPKVGGPAYKNLITDCLNSGATARIKKLFGFKAFDNPKPTSMISYLLNTLKLKPGDIVLDFFSGSATTAEVVMMSNAKNKQNTKFIMIQLRETIPNDKPAYNYGYRTIDQIGIERIIRAAKAIREEYPDTEADLGFKHFTLAEPAIETLDKLEKFDPDENKLFADKTLLDEFGKPTILATWLVRDGYGLTAHVEELDLAGYKGYYIGKHLYLVDPELPNKAIEEIVVKYETDGSFNPENIVLFGYSFTWTEIEALKINLKRLKDTEKNLRINFDIRY